MESQLVVASSLGDHHRISTLVGRSWWTADSGTQKSGSCAGPGHGLGGDADDRERLRSQAHDASNEVRVPAEGASSRRGGTRRPPAARPGSSSRSDTSRPCAGTALLADAPPPGDPRRPAAARLCPAGRELPRQTDRMGRGRAPVRTEAATSSRRRTLTSPNA